jgi:3-ketosteroid 9alpha-monooxygenase subunit B
VTDIDEVVRRHGYHHLRVRAVVEETADTRSFVLEIPDKLREDFRYQPGQFCSFRVTIGDDQPSRCYSMSSAPETDDHLVVTVKRVPGGAVSNWLNDHVSKGDLLEVTRPAGQFCLRPEDRPIVGFCGGSGVTPVMSIIKSALATSQRPIRLLYANRSSDSVIFDSALSDLDARYPGRIDLQHHFDADAGYLDEAAVASFVDGRTGSDFYLCGPGPFMELVEHALLGLGVDPDAIFVERFEAASPSEPPLAPTADASVPDEVTLILRGKKHTVGYHAGDTLLETARRANLPAPYSCEAGNCATCMALLLEGSATMRVNNALDPDEVEEGWILTCQAQPTASTVTVEYEPN